MMKDKIRPTSTRGKRTRLTMKKMKMRKRTTTRRKTCSMLRTKNSMTSLMNRVLS